jgi:hypothetical protein
MKNAYTWVAEPAQRTVTVSDLRASKGKLFLTAALVLHKYPKESDILDEAFRVLALGADAMDGVFPGERDSANR